MESVVSVCVTCRRIDRGDGVWRDRIKPSEGKGRNTICPECGRKSYPQFYEENEEPKENRFKLHFFQIDITESVT